MKKNVKDFIRNLTPDKIGISRSLVLPLEEGNAQKEHSIVQLLNIDRRLINKEGLRILEFLEDVENDFEYRDWYSKLKLKINALLHLQDIFPGMAFSENSDGMHEILYFYYEGLHLLKECFYCGLNNTLNAKDALLRLLVEFNLRQCYFFKITEKNGSYKLLRKYFTDGIIPGSTKLFNGVFDNDDFAKPIKKAINTILNELNSGSSHAYQPVYSEIDDLKFEHYYTIKNVYFWLDIDRVLTMILWCYYYCFPMLFCPVNIVKKFAFSPPVGVFISEIQGKVIKQSLDPKDYESFLQFAKSSSKVKSLLEWYEGIPSMTRQAIKRSWSKQDEKFPGINLAYIDTLIKFRVNREQLTLSALEKYKILYQQIDSTTPVPEITSFKYWQENYKN